MPERDLRLADSLRVREQPVAVHGWIYSLEDGLVRDLDFNVSSADQTVEIYRNAIRSTAASRA